MSLVTPLNRVLGLGTAKGAAEHWWMQRLTAVALVPLALWFAYGVLALPDFSFASVVDWVHRPVTSILLILFVGAAAYHSFFGWEAPHAYFSVPVVLGTAGGIGLLIGPTGLYALKRRRDAAIIDVKQDGTDIGFLALLFLTSLTGLLLMVLRETSAMGALLRIHLAVVLGLFFTLPYGKFVHGLYRSAALVRSVLETGRGKH